MKTDREKICSKLLKPCPNSGRAGLTNSHPLCHSILNQDHEPEPPPKNILDIVLFARYLIWVELSQTTTLIKQF